MATQPLLSLNQFNQQPVLGQAAFDGPGALVAIHAQVSATGAASLAPGQAVQFDSAITGVPSGLPQIVAASASQYADGYVLFDVKNTSPIVSPQVVVIVLRGILWMLSDAAINIGQVVQDGADVGGVSPFATTGAYPRGVSLDYCAAAGVLVRINLTPFTIKAAQAPAHA